MGACRYVKAWIGQCGASVADCDLCSTHLGVTCSCGEQAVTECSHTGQLVCGRPLCDACEGYSDPTKPAGSWGFGNHTHRRKITCEVLA